MASEFAGFDVNEALVFREFGRPLDVLKLEREPLPPLGAELRVRMILAPVNPSDLIPVSGAYAHRVRPPRVAGYEGVGCIVQVRDSFLSHLLGQRVLPIRNGGTWQRYADCDTTWVLPVPDDIPDDLAARGYINPLTAVLMAKRWHPAGKRVLLTAASSSCGALLNCICRQEGAIQVVGVYRNQVHVNRLESMGMVPIHENSGELAAAASDADLIFDCVGGPLLGELSRLAAGATIVSFGNLSGLPPIGLAQHPRFEQFRLLDAINCATSESWREWFSESWDVARAACLPSLRSYPIANWRDALEQFHRPGRLEKPALNFQ